MIGCVGEAITDEIDHRRDELEDARWFSQDDIRRMLEGTHETFARPLPIAIANHLIRNGRGLSASAPARRAGPVTFRRRPSGRDLVSDRFSVRRR